MSTTTATDIEVVISGQRYAVNDPEIAEHVRYLVQHADLLGLRRLRQYVLLVIRTTAGTAYEIRNQSLPFVRRAQKR